MNKLRTLLLISLCLSLGGYFAFKGSTRATDGFEVALLFTHEPQPLSNKGDEALASEVLQQPFRYLAHGGQTYVFASEDGKWVLKFCRHLPHPLIPFTKYRENKMKRAQRDMRGYDLAFEKLKKETALLYLHFDPLAPFPHQTTIIDRLGISHRIPLQHTLFILQKRAEPLPEYLKKCPDPKAALAKAFALLNYRSDLEVGDDDPPIYRNMGFIEDEPIILDPGRFVHDPAKKKKLPEKFRKWLEANYPD